jgi:hypothetical protein
MLSETVTTSVSTACNPWPNGVQSIITIYPQHWAEIIVSGTRVIYVRHVIVS